MTRVADVKGPWQYILGERACELARETGCMVRQRKFSGADRVQMVVFGFQQHPHASLEDLASTAEIRAVSVTDTAVDKRFTPACVVHAVLEDLTSVGVQAAQEVPSRLRRRFSAVIVEESSSMALPDELAQRWRGGGGNQSHTAAAVKWHTRGERKRGRLAGPKLTDGRTSDHASPFTEQEVRPGSLQVEDLGSFALERLAERRRAKASSSSGDRTRAQRWSAPAGGKGGATTGRAAERAARAGGGTCPSADASAAGARAQEDCRPAA